MPKTSAGLLMVRTIQGRTEFLLAHPGGPMWKNRDEGIWTIPKGELHDGEDPLEAAKREFTEETGIKADGAFIALPSITQKSGKKVLGWAFLGDCDPSKAESNKCSVEWPPHSGKYIEVPEVDRVEFFDYETACEKINAAQVPFLNAALAAVKQPAS